MHNENGMKRQAAFALWSVLLMGAILHLTACGSMMKSYAPREVAPELLVPCHELILAEDVGWVEAHAHNIQAYVDCRTRYDALREAVSEDH